jgi:hypothetical protein
VRSTSINQLYALVRRSPRTLGGAKGGSNGLASVRQTYTSEPKVSACARPLDLVRSLLGGGHTSVALAHLPPHGDDFERGYTPCRFFIWHEPSSAVARRVPQGALIAAHHVSSRTKGNWSGTLFDLKRCSRGAKSRFFVDFFTYRGRNMRIYLFRDESQSEIFAFLSDGTGEKRSQLSRRTPSEFCLRRLRR